MSEAFGKFLLLEKIASGGMAEVYLAKSLGANGINKFVAIKRILPQYSDNPEFIDMFKEEAKIAVNLNHGNVVSIYDFGVEKGQFYLVMEFVEGQNLRQILNHLKKENKELSIEQVIYLIKEVAAGLDHAHRCLDGTTGRPLNITHRDMSPQNVMMSFEGEVKIVDFGIAKAENQVENTRVGTIKGKFGYMSPEQADGQQVDSRTDIFSLGIVLWELLAKDRLFVAQSEAATLRRVRECQVPSLRKINPSIPPELERICNKALAKDKSIRYQTAAAFHKDLNRFLNLQFPEFSTQEFSKFMKSVYNKMYVENRKKFAEFAKSVAKEETTSVTQTSTSTMTTTETESQAVAQLRTAQKPAGNKNVVVSKPNKDEPLEIDLLSKKVDLGALRISGPDNPGRPQSRELTRSGVTGTFNRNNTYSGTGTYNTNTRIPVRKGGSSATMFTLIFLALGFFGIYHFQDQLEGNLPSLPISDLPKIETGGGKAPASATPNSGQADSASQKPPVAVAVYSTPTGALVYIDGQNKGFTPFRGWVDSGKAFRVTLIKDGYLPYDSGEVNPTGTDPLTIRSTLQPEPPMGYISIEVVNGGSDPIISVNGQRLTEKPPIQRYQVPASTPVKVRVYNPITQLSDEETVTVGVGRRKPVRLILGRTGKENN